MADYDLSRPAPDRSHRIPAGTGTGTGSLGLILVGAVIVLVVLYAIFAGAGVPLEQDPSAIAPAGEQVPLVDPVVDPAAAPVATE